jgi:hypothetical protein
MQHVLGERRFTSCGLHGVISQKIELCDVLEGNIALSDDIEAIARRHNPESNFRSWAMMSLVVGRFTYAS